LKTKIIDNIFAPLTYLSGKYLGYISRFGLKRLPVSERILMNAGVLPVADQFYQPLINPRKYLTESLRKDRDLPGIDWNESGQLSFLDNFQYNAELLDIPMAKSQTIGQQYYFNNSKFGSGDGEYYYNLIRYLKPRRIIEIGSGMSTLMALNAINKNKEENASHECHMTCIEPYQNFWLESLNVQIVRKKVEDLSMDIFQQLKANDILFIDSSHIIRPQGDVLFEYLRLLPILKPGVFIHVHDIFSPKDYLDKWILVDHKLWNEQYLLEAFLSCNKEFEIIGALNFLNHHHRDQLAAKSPILKVQLSREPGSFWFRRV
jgi:predicted O-methyltransferase YrrM